MEESINSSPFLKKLNNSQMREVKVGDGTKPDNPSCIRAGLAAHGSSPPGTLTNLMESF